MQVLWNGIDICLSQEFPQEFFEFHLILMLGDLLKSKRFTNRERND